MLENRVRERESKGKRLTGIQRREGSVAKRIGPGIAILIPFRVSLPLHEPMDILETGQMATYHSKDSKEIVAWMPRHGSRSRSSGAMCSASSVSRTDCQSASGTGVTAIRRNSVRAQRHDIRELLETGRENVSQRS